jgi:hypothetical protein
MKGKSLYVINHYAYFDALSLASRLQNSLGNVAQLEIHLFSYLACLLSLYKGRSVAEWGHQFAVTKQQTYPYSPDLNDAISQLVHNGELSAIDEYVTLGETGQAEYQFLKTLSQYSDREPLLDGACSSLLALPVGVIREALYQDPDIKGAIALSQSRRLLTESGLETLYEQFAALSSTIGIEIEDLMVPATIWLTFLSQIQGSN